MQAQEYTSAKRAIGLRLHNINEADIDQAINNGDILRTHLLRPTWHFVTPADIRWLLALTAPLLRFNTALSNLSLRFIKALAAFFAERNYQRDIFSVGGLQH